MRAKKIAIVGGASKAAAIVARAVVMRRLNIGGVPNIVVFEPNQLGGSWSGYHGYTDGEQILCTPPEMDFGFPYSSETGLREPVSDPANLKGMAVEIAHRLQTDLSWQSHLMLTDRTGERWAEYVVRGQPHPRHREWFEYHTWVFGQGKSEGAFTHEPHRVTKIYKAAGSRDAPWTVVWSDEAGNERSDVFDGIVLTGTGPANRTRVEPEDVATPFITDGYDFWKHTQHFREQAFRQPDGLRIAVLGSGGGAASILAWLASVFGHTRTQLTSVSPLGAFFPRGDGIAERHWTYDVEGWGEQTPDFRRDIIKRTDAGVISGQLKHEIEQAEIVFVASRIDKVGRSVDGRFILHDEADNEMSDATHVARAMGFDGWDLLRLVHGESGAFDIELHKRLGVWLLSPHEGKNRTVYNEERKRVGEARRKIEGEIPHDLSVPELPGLHVPGLSGLQGLGFPSLGCLGLMAARVLDAYVGG